MIGFIGFGRMGGALAKGAMAAGVLKSSQIAVYDHGPRARQTLRQAGLRLAADGAEVVRKSDIVFLCVKPQGMQAAVSSLGDWKGKKCFVSIAAGIPINKLEGWLGGEAVVYRVMPNTPALLRAGMSVLSKGPKGTPALEKRIKTILSSVGSVVVLPESRMDAVTAVSGSGPAYVFFLAEAMIAAGIRLGLSADAARTLAHQTIYGAGLMLARRPEAAEELRRQVTSPGGTTAAAIAVFEKMNLKQMVQDALRQAARRSAELAKN